MLTVAPSAAEAITAIVSQSGLPETAGVRLARASSDSAGPEIEIQLTETPAPEDQVVEEGDAHVFVEPELADALEGSTLEAAAGGDRVSFALTGPEL